MRPLTYKPLLTSFLELNAQKLVKRFMVYIVSHINTCMFIAICLLCSGQAWAKPEQTLRIAVAANFKTTLSQLTDAFKLQAGSEDTEFKISSNSTGALYAQIRHGAPFDLFFSADVKRAKLIDDAGIVLENSRQAYAFGRLVLWHPRIKINKINDFISLLNTSDMPRLAIANPKLAPYGDAAKSILTRFVSQNKLSNKLVKANNVAQVYQFVYSGNVDWGILAYSQMLQNKTQDTFMFSDSYYKPIEQQMIILKNSTKEKLASRFQVFVLSKEGQAVIENAGYKTVL